MDAQNTFHEKKWFVYLGDHHEGPFSLADIQGRMSQGQVSSAHFVWADGMTDWKVMTDVSDFGVLINAPSPKTTHHQPTAADNAAKPFIDNEPSFVSEPVKSEPVKSEPVHAAVAQADPAPAATITEAAATPQSTRIETAADVVAGAVPDKTSTSMTARPKRAPIKTIAILVLVIALVGAYAGGLLEPVLKMPMVQSLSHAVGDVVRPLAGKLSAKLPILDRLISPIAPIEDVTAEEFEELKAAARGNADAGLPQAMIALSRREAAAPSLYISSNLPDGAAIDVYIEGVPDTLLNQMSFSSKLRAVITQKIGQTGTIRYPDGRPIPKGEYVLTAIDAPDQSAGVREVLAKAPIASPQPLSPIPQDRKIVVTKRYFLGGEKDASYTERLKEFHDKLRAKAQEELGLVRQFAGTVDSQLSSTLTEAERVRKLKLKPKQTWAQPWADSDKKWKSLNAQLDETFQKWTPEVLQSEYIFGDVFLLVREGARAVEEHHAEYAKAFALKPADARPIFAALETRGQALKSFFGELTAALAQLEQSQPQLGLPKRTGILLPAVPAPAQPPAGEPPGVSP